MLRELLAEWGQLDSYLYELPPSPTLILRCRATTCHECDVNKKVGENAEINRKQSLNIFRDRLN